MYVHVLWCACRHIRRMEIVDKGLVQTTWRLCNQGTNSYTWKPCTSFLVHLFHLLANWDCVFSPRDVISSPGLFFKNTACLYFNSLSLFFLSSLSLKQESRWLKFRERTKALQPKSLLFIPETSCWVFSSTSEPSALDCRISWYRYHVPSPLPSVLIIFFLSVPL